MPSYIRWLAPLLGLLALLVGLVVHAPADTVYGWLAPAQAPVSVRNLSGTLFNGRAGAVLQQDQLRAEDLEWRLRPGALLTARLSYALSGQALGGPFTAEISATPTGRLYAAPLLASGEIKRLSSALGQGFLPLTGQWRLALERLVIKDQWPEQLAGVATVQNATWTLMRDPLVIGDFEAVLSTEANPEGGPPTLLATVRSLRGALEVEGTARQFPDRRQRADLRVRPAADAPPMVANLLAGLGRPDAEGWYRIQRDGRLP